MRKLWILRLALLFVCSHINAKVPRCLDAATDNVDSYLNQLLESYSLARSEVPELLLLRNDTEIKFESSGGIRKKIFADGFLRYEPGSYRIIPGLGLSVEADNDSLFYFCLNLNTPIASRPNGNFLRIIHLEKSGLFTKKFKTQPAPLRVKPLTEGVLLTQGIIGTFGLTQTTPSSFKQSSVVEETLNSFVQRILRVGVEQIDIREHEVEIRSAVKILVKLNVHRQSHTFPYSAKWLE